MVSLADAQKGAHVRGGLKVVELPGDRVLRTQKAVRQATCVSVHDGSGYALAEQISGWVLLTLDGGLRTFASANRTPEVRGLLWSCDELHRYRVVSAKALHAAYLVFDADDCVRLPARELTSFFQRDAALR